MPDPALALGGFTHGPRANIPFEELVLDINKELSCGLEPLGWMEENEQTGAWCSWAHRGRQ